MIEILKNIPVIIWSVALGSIIAFVGVLITNSSNTKRLKIQLDHDNNLKLIERKSVMRKDVYLRAAEDLVKASSYLGSLAQTDLTRSDIGSELQNLFVSSTKLSLVAEEETGKAVTELLIAYNGIFFDLLIEIQPISSLRNRIHFLSENYEKAQSEIKRILAEMTNQNESGAPDPKIFNALKISFDNQQKISKELTDERSECFNKLNDLNKKYVLKLINEMKTITNLQVPVMVCIRKELGIDTDIDKYKEQAQRNTERIISQLDKFLDSMNKEA